MSRPSVENRAVSMQNIVLKATEETAIPEMPVEDIVALVNHVVAANRQNHKDLLERLQVIAYNLHNLYSIADSLKRIADAMTAAK
jgi:hypothetical protein